MAATAHPRVSLGVAAVPPLGAAAHFALMAQALHQRDLDGLRARADSGDWFAADKIVDLLAGLLDERDRSDEAEQLRHLGLNPDGPIG